MFSRTGTTSTTGTTGVGVSIVALAALLTGTACGPRTADPAPAPAAGDSATTSTASGAADTTAKKAPGAKGDDQVPVGYGTQDRRALTVAVGSVAGEDVDRYRVTRVEELLQGRVAGVDVRRTATGEISVRVRGANNFVGGGEPLWVLDGMPLSTALGMNALAGIAPQDVARIEVLKDAGAVAIYGSQGANGVILISTKRQR